MYACSVSMLGQSNAATVNSNDNNDNNDNNINSNNLHVHARTSVPAPIHTQSHITIARPDRQWSPCDGRLRDKSAAAAAARTRTDQTTRSDKDSVHMVQK